MKKICFKIGEFPNVSETFIVNQIQYAIDLGYHVKVLVASLKTENIKFYKTFFNQEVVKNRVIVIDYGVPSSKILRVLAWLKLLLFHINSLDSIIGFYKYSAKFSLSHLFKWHYYYKIIKEYDIVHVQYGTKSKPLDYFRKRYSNFKLIVSFHGHDSFFPINGVIKTKSYYGLLFEHVDVVNTNTPYLTEQLVKIDCSINKIFEIPVAVNTDWFSYKEKEVRNSEIKLINVGRLHPIKGQKHLIEVVNICKQNEVDVILTIVGEGELMEDLEKEILEKNLSENVKLVGAKSQKELKELYYENDVFLFSSIPIDGREETQGLVSLEAQSCGLPVVAFDSGGVKHTFMNNQSGFLIGLYNVKEMAKKIGYLKDNQERIREMGLAGKLFVDNNYSESVIKDKWKKVYR
jgi:colanic acid/amylovoran biosynthesis glycosyltransferase